MFLKAQERITQVVASILQAIVHGSAAIHHIVLKPMA